MQTIHNQRQGKNGKKRYPTKTRKERKYDIDLFEHVTDIFWCALLDYPANERTYCCI